MLMHPNALGIATSEQRRAGGCANRGGHHEARELPTFLGNTVNIRCADGLGTKTAQVAIALIIGKYDNKIWLRSRRGFSGEKENGQKTDQDGICLFHRNCVWVERVWKQTGRLSTDKSHLLAYTSLRMPVRQCLFKPL